MDTLRERISAGIVDAMRRRDRVSAAALRSASARISNAEAIPIDTLPRAGAVEATATGVGSADAPRRELTPDDVAALVRDEVVELRGAAAHLVSAGHGDRANELLAQIDVLESLLTE